MTKSIKKRVAAIAAAMVMAVSGMVTSASAANLEVTATLSQSDNYRYAEGTATNKTTVSRKLIVTANLYGSSYNYLIQSYGAKQSVGYNGSVDSGEAKYARSSVSYARVTATLYNDAGGYGGEYANANSGYLSYSK